MEICVVNGLTDLLNNIVNKFEDVAVISSTVHTNPVNYYPKGNFIENQKKLLVNY